MAKCDLDSGEPSPTAVANWKVRFSELLNTVLTAEKKKLKRVKQQTSINFSFFSNFFNHAISSCATIVIYHKTSDKVWEAWSRQSKLPLIEVEKSTVYWVISCWVFFLETMLLKWLSFFFFFGDSINWRARRKVYDKLWVLTHSLHRTQDVPSVALIFTLSKASVSEQCLVRVRRLTFVLLFHDCN